MEKKKMSVAGKFVLGILFIFLAIAFLPSLLGFDSSTTNNTDSYAIESRARFDEIKTGFNDSELESITCLENDCSNSVVYFNFKTLPDDLDMVIRSNAVTFSNFKLEKNGTSHVTVIANLNGNQILSCNASNGQVDECK